MDIDKIILKVLRKEASLEEYEMLEEWKHSSEQNLRYLDKLMAKSGQEHINYRNFDKASAWQQINRKIGGNINYLYIIIAVILLTIASYLVYTSSTNKVNYPKKHIAENNVELVNLVDESQVHININSTLEQLNDFSEERRVTLEGEAFFDVQPDAERPFVIQLNEKDHVKVLGTSFNLVNTEDSFDLIVFSGKVELRTLNRSIILEKNDRVSRYEGAYIKLKNRNENAVSWKSGVLVFNDTPLDKVMDDLARHYDFTLQDNESAQLNNCQLKSRYENQDLEEVLDELSKIFQMEYRFDNNTLEITSINCN